MLQVLDLFSGVGGFSLGLERAGGFRTAAFCEIAEYQRKILAKHWPSVRQYDDIRTLSADRLAADGITIDAICGGFPCQDISWAGRGAGIEGSRSRLWSDYARLVGELRPRYIIVENSAALLARGMGRLLGDLAFLGYDAEWHLISASDLDAPHSRERIWVVAYPSGKRPRQLWGKWCEAQSKTAGRISWPGHEPPRERVANGVPYRLERLTSLGNAIVPQIAEMIGRAIMATDSTL